jgi:aspartate-semialdehyde dehydrogenase
VNDDGKNACGILGATGMVGQRFVHLLGNHPWFEVVAVAASPRSAGKTYAEAVAGRWAMPAEIPSAVADLVVRDVQAVEALSREVAFVFSALDMDKQAIRDLEDQYARHECPVVSNNSAHRWTPDVPMIMPEINPEHLDVIEAQRRRLGTRRGLWWSSRIARSSPTFLRFTPWPITGRLAPCRLHLSGGLRSGEDLTTWPEMVDNIIPYIGGEEDKSEREPLKIWGHIDNGEIVPAAGPVISAQCIRVPVSDGHMAAVSVSFEKKPPWN